MIQGPHKPCHQLHRDVQQKLGRIMLMLQSYERGLKSLLAHSSFEVVMTDAGVRNNLAEQQAAVSNKTLGSLVKQYTGSNVLLPKAADEAQALAPDNELDATTQLRFKFNAGITVEPDEFEHIKLRLSELVELRNHLVHHFLEQFDLQNEASLSAASDYLDDCTAEIRTHRNELKIGLHALDTARQAFAEFVTMPEFKDYFIDGISPEGREHNWPLTTIVEALRKAEQALAVAGWTRLNDAINYIQQNYPEQFPSRYRFKRWGQLIKASKLFELSKQEQPDNGTIVFYRSNQNASVISEKTQ